jgi:tripeptidyl-peptidase-1
VIDQFSIPGGQNSQNLSESGIEAAIDTQLAYGLAYPVPGVYWSTRGTPPFIPDAKYPENGNEVREMISRVEFLTDIPPPPALR